MAARKTTTEAFEQPTITADTAKAKLFELIEAKAKDMLKGPDRVNDPKTIEAIATLYNAIK
jgi:hypothetical protein